jgi:hypothetical protein
VEEKINMVIPYIQKTTIRQKHEYLFMDKKNNLQMFQKLNTAVRSVRQTKDITRKTKI